jgi:hypothetical protein
MLSHLKKNVKDRETLKEKLEEIQKKYNKAIYKFNRSAANEAALRKHADSLEKVKPQIKIKYVEREKQVANTPDSLQPILLDELLTELKSRQNKRDK